jgi:hypothetical protein
MYRQEPGWTNSVVNSWESSSILRRRSENHLGELTVAGNGSPLAGSQRFGDQIAGKTTAEAHGSWSKLLGVIEPFHEASHSL